MALTDEGRVPERAYKAMQANELGLGFGIALAERVVKSWYPDHVVSVVDAGVALMAGWSLGGSEPSKGSRSRPDFAIEAWKPGEPSKIVLVASKGNHQLPSKRARRTLRTATRQLARSSEQAEGLHVGPWNTTPCLLVSTELAGQGGIVVNALQAPGIGQLDLPRNALPRSFDSEAEDHNWPYLGQVPRPRRDAHRNEGTDGFQISEDRAAWFAQVVARTGAAGLAAFVGGGRTTAQYLTKRQGRRFYDVPTFAGSSSIHDADITVGDTKFVGTDHVFRLNTVRVVAFSGIAEPLYPLLAQGRVEEYRRQAYALRSYWQRLGSSADWDGPISFREDGTVMALRILNT
ncbi:hypothetical protein AB0442_35300 [Kitasatospora sp. NPDC085895]|uniref:hypothetical protein n=1 Tax=Kitasatospora sp. NPDC085895 TaxID=3155057 RepID=UPI0034507857